MAPLPPSNTARFRFTYTTGGEVHSFQIRSAGSPVAVGAMVDAFLGALSTAQYFKTLTGTDWAAAGSNVFNPVVTGIEGNSYGVGVPVSADRAWAFNFIGRTSGGKRCRIMIFCPTSMTTNYRYDPGEASLVDAAVNVLQGAGGLIIGIDGLTPIWKDYVNLLANAYWQKELR